MGFIEARMVALNNQDIQLGRDVRLSIWSGRAASHSGHRSGNHISDLPQEHDVERLERMQEQLKKATAMLGEALEREG